MFVKHALFPMGVLMAFLLCGSTLDFPHAVWAQDQLPQENAPTGTLSDEADFQSKHTMDVITLKAAISQALLKSPALRAFSWEIRAQEARTVQAGLLPNPDIELETENFGGEGDLKRFESAETTLRLSQLIELNGKRAKRKKIASLEHGLTEWDYHSKRADVLAQVTNAFVDVLASQEHLALADELVVLAEKVLNTVSVRVKAGKVSPVEETRAKITYSTSQIERGRTKRELEASRMQLSIILGSETPVFEKVDGRLDGIRPVPSMEQLQGFIFRNPDIARWETEVRLRDAGVALEDAKRIPDPTVHLGVRNFNESHDNAFVLGVSIPIPLFDQNREGALEARHRLARADEEYLAAKTRILSGLSEAYQSLSNAYSEATALQKDVLPDAQAAFHVSREGYRYGKFDYLFLLDAQRTLFEVKVRHIEALSRYHKAVAKVERLIGTGLDTLTETHQKKS